MSRALAFDDAKLRLHRARKRVNAIALMLSLAAMAFGVFWLVWILFETLRLGVGGLSRQVLTEMTPPPQADVGGLANAIFGSMAMVTLAICAERLMPARLRAARVTGAILLLAGAGLLLDALSG